MKFLAPTGLYDHRTRALARSVVISAGSPCVQMAAEKYVVAALRSRFLDRNTSMIWPLWSTAR